MKILYMISTHGHGRGGHFYDMKVIANAMNRTNDNLVFEVGLNKSPVVSSIKNKVYNFYFNGINFLIVLVKMIKIFYKEKPLVIHCFDNHSYAFGRILAYIKKVPIILTKCGGANPEGFFPKTSDLILMSNENYIFFQNHKKYKNSNIYLIPNRSDHIENDESAIKKIKESAKDNLVFMHISRISKYYESSLMQSISLVKDLSKYRKNIVLFIVGVIQSDGLFKRLNDYAEHENLVIFLDSDFYTINASKILDAADFVIATGRGIMEAASKDKILLSPVKESKYPTLVSGNNFFKLFEKNFSPRNNLVSNEKDNFDDILDIIDNDIRKIEYKENLKKLYFKYFDINNVIEKYDDIYKNSKFIKKIYFIDLFKNVIYAIKKIIKKRYL